MYNPKAILLDLDDTIISFDGLTNAAWNTACRKYVEAHNPPFDIETLRQKIREKVNWYWGDPKRHKEGRSNLPAARRRILKMVFQDLEIFEEALAFELADGYSAMHEASRCLMEGAFQALENMRSMDIRMAVITNGATEVQREKIHRFGLEHFFEFVLIDEEVGYSKPDVRIYEIALEKLALEPKDVWMVGDNLLWDVEGAQNLGIFAVWNDYNQKGLPEDAAVHPDMTVSSIYELSLEFQKNTVKLEP